MTFDVEAEALAFAQEIQDVLDGVLPVPATVDLDDRIVTAHTVDDVRFRVETAAKNGQVVLAKNSRPIAHMRIVFLCTADAYNAYLAVERCDIGLFSGVDSRLPIVRLDFRRDMHTAPSCHWNVHAESGPATRVLTLGNPDHSGVFSKLHFPVGGPRMRPCLEDFLQFVLQEFGVDRHPDAMSVIAEGRERWRRRQIGTSVRDAPDEAARVLRELGYTVTADSPAPPRRDRLRAY
ncbi:MULTISPECIES: hypothetical protein [unclassified Pseudonocardia]|uniref:hypothetical protein n=1 Tax=unclassified Pseudonocardia TaxID=2619320 RepID=UPI0001FFDB3E|nr:hypothetical protein [Pseudonocardia sp. Ae707_Ps1]OLM08985.1 hypothetical protein Ae707Ps1_5932c [Pseudonocardia sp. Ae707_Ps1]